MKKDFQKNPTEENDVDVLHLQNLGNALRDVTELKSNPTQMHKYRGNNKLSVMPKWEHFWFNFHA